MNEISCRVFGVFFQELKRKKLQPEVLIEGTGVEYSRFRDKNDRIDWSVFCKIMENAERIWTDDELIALGKTYLQSPFLKPVIAIARLLYTAHDFYLWTFDQQKGPSRQLFSCIEATFLKIEKNHIRVDHHMSPGYPLPGRAFYLLCIGTYQAVPLMLGEPMATVNIEMTSQGAIFDIWMSEGGGSLRWLRKAIMYPFTMKTAAQELKEAHEILTRRYTELSLARDSLERQALKLETAHRINQAVRGNLDLDYRVHAIADALIDVGKFSAVDLHFSAELDSIRIERNATRGTNDGKTLLTLALENHGRSLGEIHLWMESNSDAYERRELLEFVQPIITLALEEALAYTALSDYRENLERKVEQRTKELVEAQRVRDRIFANVNHEIRTPLSLILLTVSEMQQRVSAEISEGLVAIERSARRLLRLVEGLLLLAARQEEKFTLKRHAFDVGDLLVRIVETWKPAATSYNIRLRYDGPKSFVATLDATAIEHIVANLLSNALKFTPTDGRVTLALNPANDILEISVADTGSGIDADLRSRLFGRFEQGESAARAGIRGSGIGLSLVKELAEAHGGTVSVESEPGFGSLFRVLLPRQPELHSVHPTRHEATLHPRDFGHHDPGESHVVELKGPQRETETILVAEDDNQLRDAIGKLLAEYYCVLLAPNGLAALELARKHQPDLLITDLEMPVLGGLELTREWRQLPGNHLAPVVLLTAYGKLENRLAGFDAGVIDFVIKPFEPLELLARVRSQLQVRSMAQRLLETEKLRAEVAEYRANAAEAQSLVIRMDAERKEKETQQLFMHKLINAQEEERKRIAGDLHDSIGQEVLVMKNQLTMALNDDALSKDVKERLEKTSESATSLLEDVRRISRNLRPAHLDELGLTEALKAMLQKLSTTTSIAYSLHVDSLEGLFDQEKEINLYRIVQEGVNNILKHSNATEAEIDIEQENGSINVRMHDNGRGFDPSRLQGQQTLGLSGMRERVSILGGKFNIASHIGIGTDISIHLPIGKSTNELL